MTQQAGPGELLDWDSAKLYGEFAGGALLVVEGVAPVPMRVELWAQPVGIAPVDYQGIELRGTRGDFGADVVEHFRVEEHTRSLAQGRVGFVLIGASKREYFPPRDQE